MTVDQHDPVQVDPGGRVHVIVPEPQTRVAVIGRLDNPGQVVGVELIARCPGNGGPDLGAVNFIIINSSNADRYATRPRWGH